MTGQPPSLARTGDVTHASIPQPSPNEAGKGQSRGQVAAFDLDEQGKESNA